MMRFNFACCEIGNMRAKKSNVKGREIDNLILSTNVREKPVCNSLTYIQIESIHVFQNIHVLFCKYIYIYIYIYIIHPELRI